MSRLSWLLWVLRYSDPETTRFKSIRHAIIFELYFQWRALRGRRVTHFLEQEPLPPGKYLLTNVIPPIRVSIAGRKLTFSDEMAVEYAPYTPELASRLKAQTGRPVKVVDVSYVFGGNN